MIIAPCIINSAQFVSDTGSRREPMFRADISAPLKDIAAVCETYDLRSLTITFEGQAKHIRANAIYPVNEQALSDARSCGVALCLMTVALVAAAFCANQDDLFGVMLTLTISAACGFIASKFHRASVNGRIA